MGAVEEGFMFVGAAETAAEVEDSIVIFQRKGTEELFQCLETFTDFRWITFVGLCIGLV